MLLIIYSIFHHQIIIGFLTYKELLKGMLTSQQIIANFEKTYSDNETRREVLQNLDISTKGKNTTVLTQKEIDSAIKMRQVSSLSKGNYLIAQAHDSLTDIEGGILIGRENKGFQEISESQRHEIFQDMRDREAEIEYCSPPSATKRCKSF